MFLFTNFLINEYGMSMNTLSTQVGKKALIVVENSFVPLDVRVWYEALTLRDAGWQVTVICPSPADIDDAASHSGTLEAVNLEGVTVYYFPLRSAQTGVSAYLNEYISAFLSIGGLIWHIWRHECFDILHICNPPDMFFPYAFFYRMLGVKVIFDHHDLFPEFVRHRFLGMKGSLFYLLARGMEFLTHQSSNITIAVNESYKRIALTRGHVSPQKCVVVRNGPKISDFELVTPQPSLKKGRAFMACYLGVMGYEDGIMELVDIVRHVVYNLGRKDIYFYFMGDGSLRQPALKQIAALGLERYVEMPGMVRDKFIIKQYLSTADICIAPEPLSPLNVHSTFIKVGEYMAVGKPIVTFDLPETRITAQKAACYIPSGDTAGFGHAICRLLDDPDLRTVMGEFGRQRFLSCLSWEHQQENLLYAYNMALS